MEANPHSNSDGEASQADAATPAGTKKTRKPRKLGKPLTDAAIARLQSGKVTDPGCRGLYLTTTDRGARSWSLRYMVSGKAHETGLGSWPAVTVDAARAAVIEVRRRHGKMPPAPTTLRGETFETRASAYVKANRSKWRSAKHADQWERSLATYVYPKLGKMPLDRITTADVVGALEPIWSTLPETARRVRGRIEKVMASAIALKLAQRPNPASLRDGVGDVLPARVKRKIRHHPAIRYHDAPAFWRALEKTEGMAALALRFVMVTAGRTGEVLGARWEEVDLRGEVWTVPADRMKAGVEHRVPLSPMALQLLRSLPTFTPTGRTGLLFPGKPGLDGQQRMLSNMAMLEVMRGHKAAGTPHGMRSTFSTWAAEQAPYAPRAVVEACLAHADGSDVELAYRRTDFFERRRELMTQWSNWLEIG